MQWDTLTSIFTRHTEFVKIVYLLIVIVNERYANIKSVGILKTPTYQVEIMFNRSRWAKNCTVTPLFYICCYGAFLL